MYIHGRTFMREFVIERKKKAVATEQKKQPSEKNMSFSCIQGHRRQLRFLQVNQTIELDLQYESLFSVR